MIPLFRAAALAAVAVALASCTNPFANPYALDIQELDHGAGRQRLATIQVSGPMPFKREELLNDRLAEDKYLEELLTESKTIKFEPELVRDIEVISAMSAQLGVSFDPTGGTKFARSKELSDIEQEIAVVKLRGQLAQAQRDVQLQQEALLKQTAPSAGFGGGAPSSTQLASTQPPGLADTAAALQQVNSLIDKAAARLDAKSAEPRKTSASASPRDTFRDRQAYRNELRSARNAVALDSQHDADGNTLFRYQFKATVLPGADTEDRLGIVRMTVLPPDLFFDRNRPEERRLLGDEMTLRELYLEWLRHITVQLNQVRDDGTSAMSKQVRQLASNGELFRLIEYRYPKDPKDAKQKKECSPAVTIAGVSSKYERPADCNYLQLAVSPTRYAAIVEIVQASPKAPADDRVAEFFFKQQKGLEDRLKTDPNFQNQCPWTGSAQPGQQYLKSGLTVAAQRGAMTVLASQPATHLPALREALMGQSRLERSGSLVAEAEENSAAAAVNGYISFLLRAFSACSDSEKPDPEFQKAVLVVDPLYTPFARNLRDVPSEFREAVTASGDKTKRSLSNEARSASENAARPVRPSGEIAFPARGAVLAYAVSPAFLGQRVSTVARAADAIQLAASLAGAFPQAGVGANGSVGSGRLASGKADALERLPLVVGFTEPKLLDPIADGQRFNTSDGKPLNAKREFNSQLALPGSRYRTGEHTAFGWLLGPRARINPAEKDLKLEHAIGDYDLTVDLSMPSWWPYVDLRVETLWAPNWRDGKGATMSGEVSKSFDRTIRVRLSHTAADMDGLTDLVTRQVLGPAPRAMEILTVEPPAVSLCANTVAIIARGTNLWRTTKAFFRGVEPAELSILPDMAGVALKFSGKDIKQLQSNLNKNSGRLTLVSALGQDDIDIDVSGKDSSGECKDEASSKPAREEVSLSGLVPPTIRACGMAEFKAFAKGSNLLVLQDAHIEWTAKNLSGKLPDFLDKLVQEIRLTGPEQGRLKVAIEKLERMAFKDWKKEIEKVWPNFIFDEDKSNEVEKTGLEKRKEKWIEGIPKVTVPNPIKIVVQAPISTAKPSERVHLTEASLGLRKLGVNLVPIKAKQPELRSIYTIKDAPKLLVVPELRPNPIQEIDSESVSTELLQLIVDDKTPLYPGPDGTLPLVVRVGDKLVTSDVTIDTDYCPDLSARKSGPNVTLGGAQGAVINLCAAQPSIVVAGPSADKIERAELKDLQPAISIKKIVKDKAVELLFNHMPSVKQGTVTLNTFDKNSKATAYELRAACLPQDVSSVRLASQ